MRITEMCHGHEMKNSQNKEISFEMELFFFPSLSLVPPKFKCDYTDLIPSWRWLRDLDLRSSEQNYPLTSALENSGSWVWPTILFRYYILLEHWYNYCHIFPGWCLIWEEFLHLSAVTSSLEEGASCRCFLLGSFFLTIFSWAMLLMSHKSACKGCCGLCILQLAVKHTMNPFHSVTVSVSLEGRKGWVHLLRAEYSPTCYRPETAEINQCSFPFLGSSVKKTNTEQRGRYSHLEQKSIAEAKTITWHQLVSNKLAVFKTCMN